MELQAMYPGVPNSPQTELMAAIDSQQDTIPLLDASVLPEGPNLATIGDDETAETVLYINKSGNTLTGVTRAFEGQAKAWGAGKKVARNFTNHDFATLQANIESVFTFGADGKAEVASAISAKGGTVPGSAPYSFEELSAGVGSIDVKDYSVGDYLHFNQFGLSAPVNLFVTSPGASAGIGKDSAGVLYFAYIGANVIRKLSSAGVNAGKITIASASLQSMAMFDDHIYALYVANEELIVACLGLDGTAIWTTVIGSHLDSVRLVVRDSAVYFGAGPTLYKLDRTSGTVLWQLTAQEGYVIQHVAVDVAEEAVYFVELTDQSSNSGVLGKASPAGGRLWSDVYALNSPISVEVDGYLYQSGGCFDADGGLRSVVYPPGSVSACLALSASDVIYGTAPDGNVARYSGEDKVYELYRAFAADGPNSSISAPAVFFTDGKTVYTSDLIQLRAIHEQLKIEE